MCLILFAHRLSAEYPLVFAANRDEFFDRPTAAASFWDDAPHVLAGRDLRAGGTWMGVTRSGRWAAVTNYRGSGADEVGLRSRGDLVGAYLRDELAPDRYLAELESRANEYAGFNLLVGDADRVIYFSNRGAAPRELSPGLYGLSNHLLDTPWPKVEQGKAALRRLLDRNARPDPDALLGILYDTDVAPDHLLPDTWLGIELERLASARFIVSTTYGTRCSTAVVRTGDRMEFVERSYDPGPVARGEARFELEVAP